MDLQTSSQTYFHQKPFINLSSKPTSLYKNDKQIFIPLNDLSLSIFDIQKSKFSQFGQNLHEKRINCVKQKKNILITGSNDFTVRLWDRNTNKQIYKFQKPGSQFNVIDISQHILCGAHTSKLVFWDLRKMKQRSQFNQSFNGQITSLQFNPNQPTIFMGCSVDGMINKFDLKQPNQQQAFMWCTKVIQSPSKLQFINNVTLVQTTNHYLYLLEEQDIKNKIIVNHFQTPKHILNSKLLYTNNYQIQYFAWNLQKKFVQKWHNDQIVGYVHNVEDSQIFTPLNGSQVFYISEKGEVFIKNIQKSLQKIKPVNSKTQNNKLQGQKQVKPKQNKQSQNWQKIQQEQPANQNGFILNKPTSFKSKTKKFKPF